MHCLPISGHVIIHQTTVSFKFEIIVAVLLSAPSVVLQVLTWEHNIYKWICCQGFLPKAPSQKSFRSADILLVTAWMVQTGCQFRVTKKKKKWLTLREFYVQLPNSQHFTLVRWLTHISNIVIAMWYVIVESMCRLVFMWANSLERKPK